jgi:hypothetical protein
MPVIVVVDEILNFKLDFQMFRTHPAAVAESGFDFIY